MIHFYPLNDRITSTQWFKGMTPNLRGMKYTLTSVYRIMITSKNLKIRNGIYKTIYYSEWLLLRRVWMVYRREIEIEEYNAPQLRLASSGCEGLE